MIAYLAILGFATLLLIVFVWAIRPARKSQEPDEVAAFSEPGQQHVTYLPQIRQALIPSDSDFLVERGKKELAQRVRSERRRVALAYVDALQGDFHRLLRMAKVIAALSPEVLAIHEFERLRLSAVFSFRCQLIRASLVFRLAPVPQLSGLGQIVSAFAFRMDSAMKELAERAAMAADMASSLNGRGMDAR